MWLQVFKLQNCIFLRHNVSHKGYMAPIVYFYKIKGYMTENIMWLFDKFRLS